MKKASTLLLFACLSVSVLFAGNRPEKLLLGGSGWNKLVIIDKTTRQIEWEHPLKAGWECNSAVATPQGNILFSYGRGAQLITREHQELWNIEAPEGCEMQTARILPDGNYLLAWVGHPAVILEVSPSGKELSRTTYETGIDHPHAQFRQVNKNERGNYLLTLFATSEVREVSPQGEAIRTMRLEGTPFTTLKSKGKNCYWVACGDSHSLIEIDLDRGKELRRYGENDIPGVRLFFVAGLLPGRKGSMYICNWQGHSREAAGDHQPQLFEINAAGKVIWTLNDPSFGMISTVSKVE